MHKIFKKVIVLSILLLVLSCKENTIYKYKLEFSMHKNDDLEILKKRLDVIRLNYRIEKNNENYILFLKDNDFNIDVLAKTLFKNYHFAVDIGKRTYDNTDDKSVIKVLSCFYKINKITGIDGNNIEKAKIIKDENDLVVLSLDDKGKNELKETTKNNINNLFIIKMNGNIWASSIIQSIYENGIITLNSYYVITYDNDNNHDFSTLDIMNICLFSRYNYPFPEDNVPVKIGIIQ